jgi:hypothetical protein
MDARRLPARHGALWLLAGFALFRRHPPLMTAITFGYLLAVVVVNLVPKIGPFLLPLILPTLTVMLANGCRAIERGKAFESDTLITGISEQHVGLIRLGGLHLVGSSLLVLFGFALGEPINISDGIDHAEAVELAGDLAVILLMASPLLMAFWFAPLLTAWDGVSAGKSLFFSFIASWRNWRAFTVYALVLVLVGAVLPGLILIIAGLLSQALLTVLSIALRMMLIFILAPTMVASVYLSYRDVFAAVAPEPVQADAEPAQLDE